MTIINNKVMNVVNHSSNYRLEEKEFKVLFEVQSIYDFKAI